MFRSSILLASVLMLPACERRPVLPDMFTVQNFSLTDQQGQTWPSTAMRGKVWIASFLFTSCTDTCPMLATRLANLSSRLERYGDRVHLVSISVDPEYDTAPRLLEYSRRFNANHRWHFLTGESETIQRIIRRGFLSPLPEREVIEAAPGYNILHTTQVFLIDQRGHVRGLYPTEPGEINRLVEDVGVLLGD